MEYRAWCGSYAGPSEQLCECAQSACTKTQCQYVDISVPVQVQPQAALDQIEIECYGEPKVTCQEKCCGNTAALVITQTVCVKLPIRYAVTVCMGESTADCVNCEKTMER